MFLTAEKATVYIMPADNTSYTKVSNSQMVTLLRRGSTSGLVSILAPKPFSNDNAVSSVNLACVGVQFLDLFYFKNCND